jgi:hypothetical protein
MDFFYYKRKKKPEVIQFGFGWIDLVPNISFILPQKRNVDHNPIVERDLTQSASLHDVNQMLSVQPKNQTFAIIVALTPHPSNLAHAEPAAPFRPTGQVLVVCRVGFLAFIQKPPLWHLTASSTAASSEHGRRRCCNLVIAHCLLQ